MIKINNEVGFRDLIVIGTLIFSGIAAWVAMPQKIMAQADAKYYTKEAGCNLEKMYDRDIQEIKTDIKGLIKIHMRGR